MKTWLRTLGWAAVVLVAAALSTRPARACTCDPVVPQYPAHNEADVPTNAVLRVFVVGSPTDVAAMTLEAETSSGMWSVVPTTVRVGPVGIVDVVPRAPLQPSTAHRLMRSGTTVIPFRTGPGPRAFTDAPVTLTGVEADPLPSGGAFACSWYDGFVVQRVEGLQRGHPNRILLRRLWFQPDAGPIDPSLVGEHEMDEDAGTLRSRTAGCQTGVLLADRHTSQCVQLLVWTRDGGTQEMGERRCTEAEPHGAEGGDGAREHGPEDAACSCSVAVGRMPWAWLVLPLLTWRRFRRLGC